MQIVKVRYEDKYHAEGGFGGREYTYFAGIPLKEGDIVIAPTKYGESKAIVTKTDVSVSAIAAFKDSMKTIEKMATVEEDTQTQIMDAGTGMGAVL